MNDINLGNMKIPVIKPQKGVDYYTEAEKQELIEETTKKVNQIIEPKETERQANEQIRKSNEEDRKAQESTRIANENERQSNENTRQNNETERQNNETTRQTNEQSRIEAEQSRNTTFNNQMTENEKAIQSIKDKTAEYNANAETKTNEFNANAEQKTQTFNENANAKLQEINQIKDTTEAKIAEINEKDKSQDAEILEIKQEQIIQNTKIQTLETDNATNKQEISEQKQKNTEQDTNIKQNTDNIELLKQENIELKAKDIELEEENKRLREDLNNTVPSVPDTGENITLKGTANARFKKFGIGGNSWQETREGYNLLKPELGSNSRGLEVTYNDGVYTINGTVTEVGALTLGKVYLDNDTQYKIQNFFISGSSNFNPLISIWQNATSSFIGQTSALSNSSKSFTTSEEFVNRDLVIYVSEGNTFTNLKIKVQVCKGTEDKPYEPYGAMPSSEFESPIRNVTGSASFKIVNKNLIQIDKTIFPFSKNGLDFSLDKDGNLVVNGTSSAYTEVVLFGNGKDYFLKLFKGKFYKFNNGTTNNNLSMYYSGEKVVQFNNGTAKKIDKDIRVPVLKVQVPTANVTFVNEVFKLQFEEVESLSSPATDYTPHQSQTFTIPVQQEMLEEDKFEKVDGVWKEKHTWIKVDLSNITNNIDKSKTNTVTVSVELTKKPTNKDVLCNILKYKDDWNDTEHLKFGSNMNVIYLMLNKSIFETLDYETIKQTLKNLNAYIWYQSDDVLSLDCTEEQTAVLNQIEKTAHSYGEQTHIFSTDEISPIFDVEANADIQSMFNNLQAQILAGEV